MATNAPEKIVSAYDRYRAEVEEDIAATVAELGCQPILFVGSGLAKRYFGAPNWDELLAHLAEQCSSIDKGLGYYKQAYGDSLKIGEAFAKIYQEWAWGKGHNEFPESLFSEEVAASDYLKHKIAEHLTSLTPSSVKELKGSKYKAEISALQKIRPHAVITTNYDRMLEVLFPDLHPVIGQQILKGQQFSIGEIFKIHGCVTEPSGIVFTQSDYDTFMKKKKFLSAKLLTFFNEHPLVFIGYSATDPNIRAILSDIDQALPEKGGVIPNVYILEWSPGIDPAVSPPREKLIPTEEDRYVRAKLIQADSFTWVFEAFSANPVLNNVNPKVLRALIARSYEMVRRDIPKMKVDADFSMLTEGVEDKEAFANLFGIASVDDYSAASVQFPYSLTQLGKKLGGNGWHLAEKLIKKLKTDTGFDLKSADSKYHRAECINKSVFHKYSDDAFIILSKVQAGEAIEVEAA